ncbi:MAG: ATP-dependent helicase [Candidatus Omnitrophica bacterium]|nr:ATP-dependent helicase [Candidatus Omnitrophota bacterium]
MLKRDPSLKPSNVLALTFSKKAALQMQERVESILGSSADDLGVYTFHGFCHRFLQDHAAELGLPGRFRLLDRMESWIFLRRLLPELRPAFHWNLNDPTDCIEGFLRFMSRAKDELVSPEDFSAYCRGVADPKERERLGEVERVYRITRKRMREAGWMDFGDLILETLQALRDHPRLLARAAEEYRWILVDEFQDTNVSQIELLKVLAGSRGNLCVVGDDDQAIYRFRGASFASFLLFKEAFPALRTVRLVQNYRSTPNILSAASRLIAHNEPDRYDPKKQIASTQPPGPAVEVLVCQDEAHEAALAGETLKRLYEAQPHEERRYDRMAVLYRAHAHRKHLVKALVESGIPFFVQNGSALFEQSEIRDLVAFLKVLQDPEDSVSLFRILSHPLWGIPPQELAAMGRWAKEAGLPLRAVLDRKTGLPFSPPTEEALRQLGDELAQFQRHGLRLTAAELIPKVVEETFLRTVFRLPSQGLGDPLVFLGRFLRFVYRTAENHPESGGLSDFLWTVDSVLLSGIDVEGDEEEIPGDRVRLMTVHQAKGLEFDWVIVLGLVQGRFPARGRPESIPFPVELMKESLPQGDYHLQEERRLCYVACTRARRGLFLMTQERAYHRPSCFVREMLEGGSVEEIRKVHLEWTEEAPPPAPGIQWGGSLLQERKVLELWGRIRKLAPADQSGFQRLLKELGVLAEEVWKIAQSAPACAPARGGASSSAGRCAPGAMPLPIQEKFSFTQLETYRYCPLKYRFSYVYQIPPRPTPQMMLGVDLHACLEWLFKQVMEGEIPPLEELLKLFRRRHSKGRYGEPYQDEENLRLGVRLLTDFYKKQGGSFSPPLLVEKPFLLRLGEGWIRGVVDRVDPLPEGGVEILDYKSGKPKEEADEEEQLQLRLYALAAREAFGLDPRRISFYYLRTNQKLSFEQEGPDFEETASRVQERIAQIRSGDFSPTPSPQKCRRCDFRNLCPASMA